MNNGINQIGKARLCPTCQLEMNEEYVMRCLGDMHRASCERCGKESAVTMNYLYTMKGRVKRQRGLI